MYYIVSDIDKYKSFNINLSKFHSRMQIIEYSKWGKRTFETSGRDISFESKLYL